MPHTYPDDSPKTSQDILEGTHALPFEPIQLMVEPLPGGELSYILPNN